MSDMSSESSEREGMLDESNESESSPEVSPHGSPSDPTESSERERMSDDSEESSEA
jgi:hypothetical protein